MPSPEPLPQQKVCSRMVFCGHLVEVVANIFQDVARLFQQSHATRRIAGIVIGNLPSIIAAGIKLELAVMDQIGGELADVQHLGGLRVIEARSGHRRNRHFKKVRRAVHRIHVLVNHAPHVPALAAENPFHPKALGFVVDLGVQPLHHLVRAEQAEVAAFTGISAEGVVQSDLVKQRQIAKQGVIVRRAEVVGRGRDEQNLRAFAFRSDTSTRMPVISSSSSAANSRLSLKPCG